MPHSSNVVDRDPYFEIDTITRKIVNKSSTKTSLIHNDHNSECFTFSMPRFVEDHDMLECDLITIHYKNIDLSTKEQILGIYEITDFQEDLSNPGTILGTWLVSQNATSRVGSLEFSIHFHCYDEEGNINYSWSTSTSKGITVLESLFNSESIYTEYVDILEQYLYNVNVVLDDITAMRNEITTSETNRIESENERIAAELLRVTAENTRIENEQTRIDSEHERDIIYTSLRNDMEDATQMARDVTQEARSVIGDVTTLNGLLENRLNGGG